MTGLCPICNRLVESEEIVDSGSVYLQKNCPEHGTSRVLLSTDVDYWTWSLKFDRPGSTPFKWSSKVEKGCPQDCGICPSHRQHTCIGVIEITGQSNLNCNICFSSSPFGDHVPFSKIADMINAFVSNESNPEILQLSGGEPTLHPEIVEIVRYAKTLGIDDVVVSTNGVRLTNQEFLKEFASADPVVYLQFDTFKPEVSKKMRGEDLVETKMQVVELCKESRITVVLVPTLVRGWNDDEIGTLVEYAMKHEGIFGINFQPVSLTGRIKSTEEVEKLTIPEVLYKMENQTKGKFKKDDFRPIPCPHPHCTAICYVIADGESITPMTHIVDVDQYIDYAKDRTLVSEQVLVDAAFSKLFSTSAVPGSEKTVKTFCEACGLEVPEMLKQSIKTIGIHAFMDTDNYQLDRAQKCCIHVIQPDGKLIPFCNFNLLHTKREGEDNG